jgi:hypothetical protein
VGPGGARARPEGGQADLAVDRVRGLSLVPRDGARVLRGSSHGVAHERTLRLDQGRSRGAPRRRRDLHGRRPGHDRSRRLAAHRVPHPRGRALLRGHVLPQRGPPRDAGVPHGPDRDRHRVGPAARRGADAGTARRGCDR